MRVATLFKRLLRLGDGDNFWPANAPKEGPEGPGGCCSEIFWDHRTNSDANDNLASSSGRFVEIWNLVFPEFNVRAPHADGSPNLEQLGRSNVDTGSGLERLAAVMQGVYNNFDIDVFQSIIRQVSAITAVPYVKDAAAGTEQGDRNVLTRRISDHVRAITFCIADGALPSNSDRGYIVRRLVRRATLDIDKLGVDQARLHEIVAAVVTAMGQAYPELGKRQELVVQTLQAEERQFRRTLRKGLDMFQRALERQKGSGTFSGDEAFELVTTNGFPKEMIEELAANEGLVVDQERFQTRWAEFQAISQGGKAVEVFTSTALQQAKPRLGATPFTGAQQLEAVTQITLLEVGGQEVSEAVEGTPVRFALASTPFYAESGGQVGDTGRVRGAAMFGDGFTITVTDTQKDEGLIIHQGVVAKGTAHPGPVKAEVDAERRQAITRHHSATHLLHSALHRVLGSHVEQQGSKVSPDELRFDYNHPTAPTREQLAQVESWINQQIAAAHPVSAREMAIEQARTLGAKAQFGEKYGATVRVVSMGDGSVSLEFCGGCHVAGTAEIGGFRITSESASSAGIRRITAVAGVAARALESEQREVAEACARVLGGTVSPDPGQIEHLSRLFKALPRELPARIEQLVREVSDLSTRLRTTMVSGAGDGGMIERVDQLQFELKKLRKLDEQRKAQAAAGAIDRILASERTVAGVPLIALAVEGVDAKSLRSLAELVRSRKPSHVAVLAADEGGKALLVASVSADWQAAGISAGSLISALAKLVGGGGGGKPDFAQAGGKNAAGIPAALSAVAGLVQEALKG